MQLEKKYFDGLNADDDINLLEETDYINAENFRIGTTDIGSTMRLESIGGTLHLNTQVPAATHSFTPISAVEDEERRRIIYFLYYTEGTHQIRCHDRKTGTNYLVMDQSKADLNFSKNSLIQAKVYGDLLVYTDDKQEIKIINIEAGIKLNNPAYVTDTLPYSLNGSGRIDYEDITLLRRPPIYAPDIVKVVALFPTDTNFIAELAFQFTYRYFYRDYQYSVFGIWSRLANYNSDLENAQHKNHINTFMPLTEKIPQAVQRVELLVKNMNTGRVEAVRIWDKDITPDAAAINNHNTGGVPLQYDFYNNKSGTVVSPAEINKIEENIPRWCKTLDTARKRLFIANYLEGFNSPTVTSLQLTQIASSSSPTILAQPVVRFDMVYYKFTSPDLGTNRFNSAYLVFLPSVPVPGWYYIPGTEVISTTGFILPPPPPASIVFASLLFAGTTEEQVKAYFSDPGYGATTHTTTGGVFTMDITSVPTAAVQVYKSNSPHQYGVAFYDRLKRRIGMITNESLVQNITDRVYGSTSFIGSVSWTLTNPPVAGEIPVEAYYYSIVRTLNLRTRYFVQTYVDSCRYAKKGEDGLIAVDGAPGAPTTGQQYIAIDTQSLIKDGMGYVFNQDDFARIYFFDGAAATQIQTLKVVGVQGRYILCEFFNFGTFDANDKMVVEVFRYYKPSETEPFFEIGNMFSISNAGTGAREYSITTGVIPGDVYMLDRISVAGASYRAEAMSSNDKFWQTWWTDAGRIFENIKNKEIRKPYSIAFSNVYVIGTQENGLSAFETLDTEDVSPESGSIQKLLLTSKVQDDGTVMLVICWNETLAMYLGEAQISDSNSTAFFVKSDGVIGSINALRGSYGTQNAESVILHRGQAYWYDAYNGCFVRYDVNGLFPVSDYKMRRVAKLIGDKYLSMSQADIEALGSRPFIFGGIDPYHNEVMWAIPKLGNVPHQPLADYAATTGGAGEISTADYPYDIYDNKAKVLVYKISKERWIGAYTFEPHYFVAVGSELFSLKNGGLWEHNAKTVWNTFYNVPYRARIMFAVNKNPSAVKIVLSKSLEGSNRPEFTHLRSEIPFEQSSDLVRTDYIEREGQFYAAVLRDRLSPNVPGTPEQRMMNGDRMRTAALRCMMEFSETTSQVYVRFVNVTYNISSGHLN